MTFPRRALPLGIALCSLLAADPSARADELKTDVNGKIQTDLRFRMQNMTSGPYYDRFSQPQGVERNQNLFTLKFKANYGKFTGVASADFYLNGYTQKLEGIG